MKKLIYTFLSLVLILGCDERLEELNTDKINPSEVDPSSLFLRGLKETYYNVLNTNVNSNPFKLYAQYWAQTTYPEESQYNLTSRNIPLGVWTNVYRDALADLNEAKRLIQAEIDAENFVEISEAEYQNRIAVINIMMAYNYAILVDVFGNVPFTEALNPEEITPAYDDAADIYDEVIQMLTDAANNAEVGVQGFPASQDPLYNGDMESWVKFANTLKLRYGMRLADVNPSKSVTVVNEALAGGVFESNEDNAAMPYQAAAPNTNPIYEDLVLSGRSDFVISNTFADELNDLQDPRLFVYASSPVLFSFPDSNEDGVAEDSTFTTDGLYLIYDENENGYDEQDSVRYVEGDITLSGDLDGIVRVFKGGTYGDANSFSGNAKVSGLLYDNPDFPGTILNYAEVEFLKAEAIERGGYNVSGTAEEHYNEGIKASFLQWGVDTEQNMDDYMDYIAQPDVAYSTAPGDWRQKIGTQLWIALYLQGLEAWSTYRRLDFEGLNPLPGDDDVSVPNRLTYPLEEAQLNGAELRAASSAIGGDEVTTRVFWDVN